MTKPLIVPAPVIASVPTFPTEFGGQVTVVAYDAISDRYYGMGNLAWQLTDGVMVTPVEDRKDA
jgi:hypothetical protein